MTMPLAGRRRFGRGRPPVEPVGEPDSRPRPADVLLSLLPTAAVLVDAADNVRMSNRAAVSLGIVRGPRLAAAGVAALVRTARRTQDPQVVELSVDLGGFPRRVVNLGARAIPLDHDEVALVVDDLTESRRVDAVRRDFIANVGHEIKTPVGALSLLAEAALDARDDQDAVARFLTRMQHEAKRLSRLVQELLELSRLQGGESPPSPGQVSVDAVIDEAVDRGRLVAEAKQIEIVRGGDNGCLVLGSEHQLVTAVSNLLDNAVAYSPEQTEIAVGVRRRGELVEIAVRDQGIGIAAADQERIFERFYRVDPARSRDTGGTGLGLAIVKHVVSNHGGQIQVWSQPGAGTTFTLQLPASDGLVTSPDEQGNPPA
jgi:two-component system sensor histidine kinase SenX3